MYSAGQIPLVANVPNGSVNTITGTTNIVAIGVDANGKTVYTAGAKGGRVYSLTAVTDETADADIHVWILRGATVIPLGCVKIPLGSGLTSGVPNVDLLDNAVIRGMVPDGTGKRYIPLMGGDVLRFGSRIAMTVGKTCWLQAQGADYQA